MNSYSLSGSKAEGLCTLKYLCFKIETNRDPVYLKGNLVLLCNLFVFSSYPEWSLIAFLKSCRLGVHDRMKVHHSHNTIHDIGIKCG